MSERRVVRDRYQGAPLVLGAEHAGDQVRGAGAGAGHHHRGLAGHAGHPVGGVGRRRLVPGHQQPHPELGPQTFQGFQEDHVRAVRDRPDVTHPLSVQAS